MEHRGELRSELCFELCSEKGRFIPMKNFIWRLGFTLTILGIMFTVMSAGDVIDSFKTPLNYNFMTSADVKDGTVVEGNLLYNFGPYEESYQRGRFGQKIGGSAYYYLIPLIGGEEETYVMGFYTGNQELISALDRQSEETYSMLDTDAQPTPIHFKGKITKMDNEDENYFREGLVEIGLTYEEAQEYGIKSYIKVIYYDNIWVPLIFGIFALLLGAAILVIMFIRKRQGL